MYELPPILQGSEREQLAQLRDYLVRMSRDLDKQVENAVQGNPTIISSARGSGPSAPKSVEDVRREAAELRALIVKTAHTVEHNIERITQELHEDYLAVSDFGTYAENINATFEQTARGVVESYDYESALQAIDARVGDVAAAATLISGEIRRGLITDPQTGETAMGIAIAEKLDFTGAVQTEGGQDYYELKPGQTLGIYTSTGWQYWINGSKCGWFDGVDSMLHTRSIVVENELHLGAGWVISTDGGLGIKVNG